MNEGRTRVGIKTRNSTLQKSTRSKKGVTHSTLPKKQRLRLVSQYPESSKLLSNSSNSSRLEALSNSASRFQVLKETGSQRFKLKVHQDIYRKKNQRFRFHYKLLQLEYYNNKERRLNREEWEKKERKNRRCRTSQWLKTQENKEIKRNFVEELNTLRNKLKTVKNNNNENKNKKLKKEKKWANTRYSEELKYIIIRSLYTKKKRRNGFRIQISGRIRGADMARSIVMKHRGFSARSLNRKVQYEFREIRTKWGIWGLKTHMT